MKELGVHQMGGPQWTAQIGAQSKKDNCQQCGDDSECSSDQCVCKGTDTMCFCVPDRLVHWDGNDYTGADGICSLCWPRGNWPTFASGWKESWKESCSSKVEKDFGIEFNST